MRTALVLTPSGRAGYAGSSHLDALSRGEKAILVGSASDPACFAKAVRWLGRVDVLAVYDDLIVTDTMLSVIAIAQELGVPVEYRHIPAGRVSIMDRAANAA